MIKKIYIIRHGQTDYNSLGIVQGSGIDADLNKLGRKQAQAFYENYRNEGFQKVFISGLKRTQQSVASFLSEGLPSEVMPELNEISWGKHEGVAVDAEGEAYYQSMIERWKSGETHLAIEGGESPVQVANRMQLAITKILASPEEKVLVCMHGRAMRVLLAVMLNYPLQYMDVFDHQNLCLYQLIHTGNLFHIEKYNQTAHLSSLA